MTFMADDPLNPNQPPPAADPTPTPDGQGKNPADQPRGADTPPANPLEAKPDDKPDKSTDTKIDENSPEFKAALTRAITAKLPQLQKQARKDVAKELSGEKEGEPTVEQLKTQIDGANTELRRYRARDQVEDYVGDKRNQLQVRNMKALIRYVEHQFEYDDQGKVTNLKELLTSAKLEVPELFGGSSSSIDAGNGSRQMATTDPMNALIRGR